MNLSSVAPSASKASTMTVKCSLKRARTVFRPEVLGHRREPLEVREQHGDLAFLAAELQPRRVAQQEVDDAGGDVVLERAADRATLACAEAVPVRRRRRERRDERQHWADHRQTDLRRPGERPPREREQRRDRHAHGDEPGARRESLEGEAREHGEQEGHAMPARERGERVTHLAVAGDGVEEARVDLHARGATPHRGRVVIGHVDVRGDGHRASDEDDLAGEDARREQRRGIERLVVRHRLHADPRRPGESDQARARLIGRETGLRHARGRRCQRGSPLDLERALAARRRLDRG